MLTELAYRPDSAQVFRNLLGHPYCVFLDSGHSSTFAGRYDILAASPYVTLTTRGDETEIRSRERIEVSCRDPLELIREQLGERDAIDFGTYEIPFSGGAIGYFAYDFGRRFEQVDGSSVRDIDLPEMVIGLYDWALVVDHEQRQSLLVGHERDSSTKERWDELVALFGDSIGQPRPGFEVVSDIRSDFDRESYAKAFTRIQDHIRCGDCYQVNLAQRFEAKVQGDSWNAYLALRQLSPAPYSAYFSTPHGDVLSSSPEQFLFVEDGLVQSKPIKGTRPVSTDRAVDAVMQSDLAASTKDRAENIMIVDLVRNDLGKSCVPGSVRAATVYDIESFAHVHHLVSTVTGELLEDRDSLDLVRGCFPGGSITGAPKVRAMQIIDELEPHRRSIYCGSIGYLGFNGSMNLNIAIRTLLRCGDSIYAWAGGGIVADSKADSEYQECFDKASGLLAVLSGSSISAAS